MNSKEKRAFETLIVSELRKADELPLDFSKEVELTQTEAEVLASVDEDFLDSVVAGKFKGIECEPDVVFIENVEEPKLVLNRAEDVSECDNDELNENERALIQRKMQERENGSSNKE